MDANFNANENTRTEEEESGDYDPASAGQDQDSGTANADGRTTQAGAPSAAEVVAGADVRNNDDDDDQQQMDTSVTLGEWELGSYWQSLPSN